ncbi:alpha/beta fold hydrolase [Streptomyces sp. NPDC005438]|uniref:thioesterase II family protein n=1 Tax=Streptomyces sp. NPDC005438 TaxID=3156880 RepID=UPI0033B7F584
MGTDTLRHPCLRTFEDTGDARVRLFCLPHAGGSASAYREWQRALGTSVEVVAVQYPGRGSRIGEPSLTRMPDLVADLLEGVGPWTKRPWALFGHSMGAAVAHELAHAVARAGYPDPLRLFVSAREAPQLSRPGTVHQRDDDGLVAELSRLAGTATELLADPQARRLFLPPVRADYQLIETYRPTMEPLRCPVTALAADSDPEATREEVAAWRAVSPEGFELSEWSGHHFYLDDHLPEVARLITDRLDADLG